MSTEVATSKDFQERMFERIRSSMGDLMTDEELKKIVDAAVHKAFFEPTIKVESEGTYHRREVPGPPHIVTLIDELIRDNVKELTRAWLEAHSEELLEIVRKRLDGGIVNAVSQAINTMMADRFMRFQNEMYDAFRNMPR